jgi:hypothetical protein
MSNQPQASAPTRLSRRNHLTTVRPVGLVPLGLPASPHVNSRRALVDHADHPFGTLS